MIRGSSKHIPILDGIRAYAILIVCIAHFFQVDELGLYDSHRYFGIFLFKLSQVGLKGVELFFILSGFLITRILIASKQSARYWTSFYARRFIRIFPLYYMVLAFSFIVLPNLTVIDQASKGVIENQIWLWTYTSNISQHLGFSVNWDSVGNFPSFGHFWSLCVEEHFYIFWPAIIYLLDGKRRTAIMWLFVIGSALSILLTNLYPNSLSILTWSTLRYSGILSLGGLVAVAYNSPTSWYRISSIAEKIVLPCASLFFLLHFIPRRYEILYISTYFASTLAFLAILIVSINNNRVANILFKHNCLYFVGKISYGLYVYHGLLRPYFKTYLYDNLLKSLNHGIIASIVYTITAVFCSIIIAWLSWVYIEKPLLKLKKYFPY